jgi:predicted membrane protein
VQTRTNAAVISNDINVNLQVTTGGITTNVTLPAGVGGSFDASARLGGVTVSPHGTWAQTSGHHYQTPDYGTAENAVTITAETAIGGITADLA